MNKISILFILLLFNFSTVKAEIIIRGTIQDSETMQVLPSANIQIEGTYKGTITNSNGIFQLSVKKLPVKIKIRYIGYATQSIIVTKNSNEKLQIYLIPVVIPLQTVVVTAEDPAVRLMREVIKTKQQWQKHLKTFKANAYSRVDIANDSGIVYINERISDIFWDIEKGHREVIRTKYGTSNFEEDDFDTDVSFCFNFYTDEIEIEKLKFIGPTHPKTLKYYEFKIVGQRAIGDKTIYDLSVTPKSKLQPTFTGQISILDEDYALIEANLKPAKHIIFPFPVQGYNISFIQHFSNYDKDFWLPVDLLMNGYVQVGFPGLQFPRFYYKNILSIKDYHVNFNIPDSLYKKEEILQEDLVDSKVDSLFNQNNFVVPLDSIEKAAYEEIDSSMYFVDAFTPMGILAKPAIDGMKEDADKARDQKRQQESSARSSLYLSPQLWYNRVDGFHMGLCNFFNLTTNIKLNFSGAYKTVLKKWAFGAGIDYALTKNRNNRLTLEYYKGCEARYESELYSQTVASILPLFGRTDYFDYFWNEKIRSSIHCEFEHIKTNLSFGLNIEKHNSLAASSIKSLSGATIKKRINPAIEEGNLRSLEFNLKYGSKYTPFGVTSQKRLLLDFEYSDPDLLSSDFSFTRWQLIMDWRVNTFLKRRALPNCIDFRVMAGTYTGDIPIQKFSILDSGLGAFSSFGSFKTMQDNPYEGEKYFGFWGEHNFRTVPFELLNLNFIAKHGMEFIIHGGIGRTWISTNRLKTLGYNPQYQDKYHSEVGISINKFMYILRFDLSYRLDEKGYYFTISAPRMK